MPSCPNCFRSTKIHQVVSGKFSVYFCEKCQNGFTYPILENIGKYYNNHYWSTPGILGKAKDIVFKVFQKRRLAWVKSKIPGGKVLDVGSGEGKFGASLPPQYVAVNLEPPESKVKNKSVKKQDFLKWKTSQKFDAICFWQSLEHTPYPQKYLSRAYQLLCKEGYLFIEYPNYNSLESKMFGKYWFHQDLPRHLVHLTPRGLEILLKRCGYTNICSKSIAAYDYTPWGFGASILNIIRKNYTEDLKRSPGILQLAISLPFAAVGLIIETIFAIFNKSPIEFNVAQKDE